MFSVFHDALAVTADCRPDDTALQSKRQKLTYREVLEESRKFADGLVEIGVRVGDRVAILLPNSIEAVVSIYAISMIGGVFVPINPLLRPRQVSHVVRDCGALVLVCQGKYLDSLTEEFQVDASTIMISVGGVSPQSPTKYIQGPIIGWEELSAVRRSDGSRRGVKSSDIAGLMYTSGSTGKPKGVVLSHENLVDGARIVSEYLGNNRSDKIVSALPFSFDYGLSQVSTAFYAGATLVVTAYKLPRAFLSDVEELGVTAIAGVPTMWNQLSRQSWSRNIAANLRYITNSGGKLSVAIARQLAQALPQTKIFLMYGLTESFRSTYLDPEQTLVRPNSIGKPIDGVRIDILKEDGSECGAGEPGELVHSGALVAKGYWNDPQMTRLRFKPLPQSLCDSDDLTPAVWSGDLVKRDSEGYLYFIERSDALIKSAGFRISPTEIEDVVLATGVIEQVVAVGLDDPELGQVVTLAVVSSSDKEAVEKARVYVQIT